MKIGLYTITYLGVWYKGEALPLREIMQSAKQEGWEGIEFDTKRPHASPMDLSAAERKDLRQMSADLDLPISAVSPNCDLSSPVPEQREAMICFVRECIKLARDLGSPICKIFAGWRGVAARDGLASYEYTKHDPYPDWEKDRWGFARESLKELADFAQAHEIVLALQNHHPVIRNYKDVLSFIKEVGSPALKACMDIPIEGDNSGSDDWARQMVKETGPLQVHSHYNGDFARNAQGQVVLMGPRKVAYEAYVRALVESGFKGSMNWEYCQPALEGGKPAGIEFVRNQTRLALEFMRGLRERAQAGN